MKPRFFAKADGFRSWLEKHHETETELLVAFYKKGSGKPSITYQEALDEALIVGWIDGIRRTLDEESYTIRFTPRKATQHLESREHQARQRAHGGRAHAREGLAAFAKRDEKRSAIYSYERGGAVLEGDALAALKADRKAWKYYEAQAPWYKRTSAHWVTSAKKPETRARRLTTLIECSRKGERIPPLAY